MSRSKTPARERAAVAAAAVAAFGVALFGRGWPRDDRWLILEHPLLRAGWPGARELLFSGYVAPLLGAETPIHEWRPLLSLSFLLQRVTTGFAPLPLHAVNLALHVAVCLLVLEALRRRLSARAALAGALVFAVLPVHAEVVAYLTSRSEMLAALSVLGAWLLLGAPERPSPRRVAAGAAVYLAGALSKEHALLFPAFLALADWTFAGKLPWEPERRRVHLALGLAAALVLLGRAVVLPRLAGGGAPYFSTTPLLARLLTLAKFWIWDYVRPALTGAGLCSDFARPLVPDARPDDLLAWASLLAVAAALAAALAAAARRRAWGFWLCGPCLFLLPTSHLLMNLDTLGAQRFLYLPALGLAAGAGALFARAESRRALAARAALALALVWLGGRAAVRAADWRDDVSYYRAAASCNPVSAKSRDGLGLALLRAGKPEEGERELLAARALAPGLYDAADNLARLSYERGDWAAARARLEAARALRPDAPDGLVLEALLDERDGRAADAAAALARAVAVNPDDPVARYDFARALARRGSPAAAAEQIRAFLRLAPDDPDAPAARRWLAELAAAGEVR
jgi:tetratricopeptide (TPR) repeat protein